MIELIEEMRFVIWWVLQIVHKIYCKIASIEFITWESVAYTSS